MKQYGFTRDVRDVHNYYQKAAGFQITANLNNSMVVGEQTHRRNNATS